MKHIIWFDCDGVLTDHPSSWMYLHEYFGSKDNSFFAELYRKGLITYLDWMKIDIALMINSYGKPIRREDVVKALEHIRIRREAIHVVEELRKIGFDIGVISSGVDLLVSKICRAIDSDYCLYNELYFVDDILIPGGKDNVPLENKDQIILDHAKKHGIPVENIVYVGDSIWDIDVFKTVGLSIAVKPCGEACRYADYVVENLSMIPGIVRKHYTV